MSKPKKSTSLADMSLPPEQRRRRRKPGRIVTPPAQLDHANSPRARAVRRDGERWLAAETTARFAEKAGVTLSPWQEKLLNDVFETDGPLFPPYRREPS